MPPACSSIKHTGRLVQVSANTALLRNRLAAYSEQAGGMFYYGSSNIASDKADVGDHEKTGDDEEKYQKIAPYGVP